MAMPPAAINDGVGEATAAEVSMTVDGGAPAAGMAASDGMDVDVEGGETTSAQPPTQEANSDNAGHVEAMTAGPAEGDATATDQPAADAPAPEPVEVIVVDATPDPPVFPTPEDVVLAEMPLSHAGDGDELRLLLQQETMRVQVTGAPLNLRNLMGRSFLDLPGVFFDPKKMDQGWLQLKMGPYTVKLFTTGTMELSGAFRDENMARSVALKVAECCKRSGSPIELVDGFTTSAVKAHCNVGRSVILAKLSKQPGASPVSGSGTAQFVELNMGANGKVMCFSTGKISVTTPSRVLAKRCFMDAVVKIRPCVAIQVGSSLKRPASSPAAEPASKLSRRVEHEGHGGSEGAADDTSAADDVDATAEDDATQAVNTEAMETDAAEADTVADTPDVVAEPASSSSGQAPTENANDDNSDDDNDDNDDDEELVDA